MRDTEVTHKDTFLLGRTRGDSRRMLEYVSAEVQFGKMVGSFPTIEHTTVTDPAVLSITFTVGPRPANNPEWDQLVNHVGQVPTADRKIVRPPLEDKYRWGERPGYDLRHTIDVLWREWNLNSMEAGCVHQDVTEYLRQGVREDPNMALGDRVRRCPFTDYKWGSQWLVKPLTEAALERIASLNLTEVEKGDAA